MRHLALRLAAASSARFRWQSATATSSAPGGNWSSYPPHRHDGIGDCPHTNEEIYYFRIGREDGPHGDPTGSGLFRVYTVDGGVDETVTLRDGDVYLVPEGYHGPSVAPPEYSPA